MWNAFELPVPPEICDTCRHSNAAAKLPNSLWEEIDPLVFANRKIIAIKQLKEFCQCPLHDALGIYVERYKQLRESSPSKFHQTDDEYWAGFES